MKGVALQSLDRSTGEVVTKAVFDITTYLDAVSSEAAFKTQQALAAAYDKACAALIGPNDVQQEKGGRSFKKKSAWRKLARHFTLSTEVISSAMAYHEEDFVATVVVRASAPWGQFADAVGACSKSEESGQRTITIADALATAETRATNRATSNLIAMGEVSAEEIGDRSAFSGGTTKGNRPVMPFGKTKGTPLTDLPEGELLGAIEWARSKNKFTEFQAEAQAELDRRAAPAPSATLEAPSPGHGYPDGESAEGDPGSVLLPGGPAKWGNNGGKPMREVPTHALEAFAAWVGKQSEPTDALVWAAEAASAELGQRQELGQPADAAPFSGHGIDSDAAQVSYGEGKP